MSKPEKQPKAKQSAMKHLPDSDSSNYLAVGKLKDKIAVITGAARGIGRAVAVAFAKEGASVIGIDKAAEVSPATAYKAATAEDLSETARLVEAAGGSFKAFTSDVRDLDALRRIAGEIKAEFGKIDVLFANAGIQVFAPLLSMSDEQWTDVIDVNLNGTANTVRAFAPLMAQNANGGSIIVTASGQGKKGFRHGSGYAASKWGIIGFMKSAAIDLGEHKIRVNALVPGLVATEMTLNETRLKESWQDYRSDPPENITPEQAAAIRAPRTPMKMPWVTAEDMAPMVVFLASDEAKHISGASFDVDAGDSAMFTA